MELCTVPMGYEKNEVGEVTGYKCCGEKAMYMVGNWYVCESHKKHYTDPNKWGAILLGGDNDD